MAHQCLNCGKIYTDTKIIENGCPNCGGKFFYYIRKPLETEKRIKILKEIEKEKFFEGEREKIENIIKRIEAEKEKAEKEMEEMKERIESINIKEIGDYEINVRKLAEDGSIIINREGVYFIYLPSLFQKKK
ncbi:MAG: Zn-ribbon containing protein [Candidatus Thermoplasmatota archaeon]